MMPAWFWTRTRRLARPSLVALTVSVGLISLGPVAGAPAMSQQQFILAAARDLPGGQAAPTF